MNKRRLLKLADLLEEDADNKKGIKFDIAGWGSTDDTTPVAHNCGTAACAMGLAVISGAFKRAGLRNSGGKDSTSIYPMVGDFGGYDAAKALFDISINEAFFLFWGGSYPATRQSGAMAERYVAKRIKDFVAGKVSAEAS